MSQQINLASPHLLKPRYAFGLREMAIGLGLMLAVMLIWSAYLVYQAGVLEKQADKQEAAQTTAQQELDQLTANATRAVSPLLIERNKIAQAQVAQRERVLEAIRVTLEKTSAGFSPRLRALAHSSIEGVWLNGFTLSPGHVELKGSVLNAGLLTTYIDRLGKQAPFAGTSFSGMTASQVTVTDKAAADTAQPPAHLDFTLYAGSQAETRSSAGARQ